MRLLSSVAFICVISAGQLAAQGAQDAQDAPPPSVTVAKVQEEQLSQEVTYNGRLDADSSIGLIARVPGFLESVDFRAGDTVNQGDVLFRIERAQYFAAVRQAEGSLMSAQAIAKDAEIERDRQNELVKRNTASVQALQQAEAALGKAQGSVMQIEAELDVAKLNLSYTEVKAPFPGRMSDWNYDPGALVGPDSGPLAVLTKLDPMKLNFQVPTAALRQTQKQIASGEIKLDSAVRIVLADGEEYSREGKITYIDDVVDAVTDSVQVQAVFQNPDGKLRHDELVRVKLAETSADKVLTVPVEAIQRDQVGAFVLLVDKDSTVEKRRVDVSRRTGSVAVISNGLSAGDQVITQGSNKARVGGKVDAAEAGDGSNADGASPSGESSGDGGGAKDSGEGAQKEGGGQ